MISLPFKLRGGSQIVSKIIGNRGLRGLFSSLAVNCRSSISFGSFLVPFTYITISVIDNGSCMFRGNDLPLTVHTDVTVPTIFAPIQLSDVILISNKLGGGCPISITLTVKTSVIVNISLTADSLHDCSHLRSPNSVTARVVTLRNCSGCRQGHSQASLLFHPSVRPCHSSDFTPTTLSAVLREKRTSTHHR